MRPPALLLVGGTDPTAGAGLGLDLRVAAAHGTYPLPVATAVTAQGSRGVAAVEPLPRRLVAAQLAAVLEELEPAAVKTGMLATAAAVETVAEALAARPGLPLVVDPVVAASDGTPLLEPGALAALRRLLLPRATLVTPNVPEAAALLGLPHLPPGSLDHACAELLALGPRAALLTGGHAGEGGQVVDRLATAGAPAVIRLAGRRLPGRGAHGTGCALATAVAARLARGEALPDAVRGARRWLRRQLVTARRAGLGREADLLLAAIRRGRADARR